MVRVGFLVCEPGPWWGASAVVHTGCLAQHPAQNEHSRPVLPLSSQTLRSFPVLLICELVGSSPWVRNGGLDVCLPSFIQSPCPCSIASTTSPAEVSQAQTLQACVLTLSQQTWASITPHPEKTSINGSLESCLELGKLCGQQLYPSAALDLAPQGSSG